MLSGLDLASVERGNRIYVRDIPATQARLASAVRFRIRAVDREI
jgi:hypothetical protein